MIRNMLIATFLTLFALNAFACEPSEEELELERKKRKEYEAKFDSFKKRGLTHELWLEISKGTYSCDGEYDYPDSTFRYLYCQLKSIIPYSKIVKMFGKRIFVSGPHTLDTIDLSSRTSFGHYDKDFVIWLNNKIRPILRDKEFVKFSKDIYEHTYGWALRTYYTTYFLLESDKKLKRSLIQQYIKNMSEAYHYTGYDHEWHDIQSSFFETKVPSEFQILYSDGPNAAPPAIHYWLRRSIDGTDKEFVKLIENILKAYDREFLLEFRSLSNNAIFENLAQHLDSKFKHDVLSELTPNQLRILRNAIYASYGYKFKDEKLYWYFMKNIDKFCRGKKCGVVSENYSDSLLTEIDRENIKLIKEAEDRFSGD
jgi:hypothetical protein